jgi:hypothetical protein
LIIGVNIGTLLHRLRRRKNSSATCREQSAPYRALDPLIDLTQYSARIDMIKINVYPDRLSARLALAGLAANRLPRPLIKESSHENGVHHPQRALRQERAGTAQ